MIAVAKILKSTGSRIIFFTTTDIVKNGVFDAGRERDLNEIAKRVLPPMGVEVYDLYSVALTIERGHNDDVHFTAEANEILGEYVKNIVLYDNN